MYLALSRKTGRTERQTPMKRFFFYQASRDGHWKKSEASNIFDVLFSLVPFVLPIARISRLPEDAVTRARIFLSLIVLDFIADRKAKLHRKFGVLRKQRRDFCALFNFFLRKIGFAQKILYYCYS